MLGRNMSNVLEKLLPKVGEVIGGRYRVDSTLGEGGFGVVFAATQENLNRGVAIKMLLPHALTDSMAVNRFQREVDLARRLEHPNTVRIYDRGQTDRGLQYYVMEYVKGATLGDVIEGQGPLAQARVKRIVEQTLMSLGEAHSLGFAHRDLKPGNIMITEVFGEKDFVKVLDFGISKNFGGGEQETADPTTIGLIGTPFYMSPEQAAGAKEIDGRSDLYSLGLIMNEMLTGRKIFEGPSPLAVLMAQVEKSPVPIPPEVAHSSLGHIVMRAVAKDLGQRYASAQDMLCELQATAALPVAIEGSRQTWPDAPAAPPHTPMGMTGHPQTPQSAPMPPLSYQVGASTGPSAAPQPPPQHPQGAGWSPHSATMSDPCMMTGTTAKPKGVSAGLIVALVLVLLAAVGSVVFFVVLPGDGEEPDGGVVEEEDADQPDVGEEADAGIALAPDVTPQRDLSRAVTVDAEEDQTHVVSVPDTGEHEPTPRVVNYQALLAEGAGLMTAGRWEEAIERFDQVPSSNALYAQAMRNRQLAHLGIDQRSIFNQVVDADLRSDYATVQTLLEQIPAGSYYRSEGQQRGIEARLAAYVRESQALAQADAGEETADAGTGPAAGEPVVVHIDGRPRRASIRLDGERVCRLPCDLELPPGEGPVEIRVSKTDHCSRTVEIAREHGRTYEVRLSEGCYGSIIP